jgi:hypothetical protein
MKHLKQFENIFHNSSLYSVYNEDFWHQVIKDVGEILGVQTHLELSMDINDDDDFVEFGIDIGSNVYSLSFDLYDNGTANFRAVRYPQGDNEIELNDIHIDKGPKVVAAFLATVLS